MEIKYIGNRATYFEHEVTIEINGKTIDYIVNTAFLSNGKKWMQNYGKTIKCKRIKLTTSERKRIKKYFENDFIDYASIKNDNSIHSPSSLE